MESVVEKSEAVPSVSPELLEDLGRIEETINARRAKELAKKQVALLNERHSKHARWMYVEGILVKFHTTKRRPWVLRDERRKKNKRSKVSRRRNR